MKRYKPGRNVILTVILAAAILIVAAWLPARALAREPEPVALVEIRWTRPAALKAIENTGVALYARLNDDRGLYLLAGATPGELEALRQAPVSLRVLDPDLAGDYYFFAYPLPGWPVPAWEHYGRVVIDDGARLLLEMTPAAAQRLAPQGVRLQALKLQPLPPRSTLRQSLVPLLVGPDLRVQAMIDAVDSAALYQYVGDLSGEWPAEVGGQPYTIATRFTNSGTPIHKATQYVGERLANLGLDVEYHTWQAGRPPNVIGELPGPSGTDDILMLTAHLDSTTYDTPYTLAPGADDNASGSVAVLTAAEILSRYPWRCTLRFAFWTGEEQGLLGSSAYAQRSFFAGEPIQGVLNLDMIAWNTPGTPRTIDLHADQYDVPPSMELAQLFADVVDVYGLDLIPDIVPSGTGASDHASFWYYGYNAILGIEDFGDFNPYYHSNDDTLDHLDLSYYTDLVKASIATLAHMGCLAQGAIAGHVTDVALGTPLAATVHLTGALGSTYELTTDAAGYYSHTVLPDTYTVVVTAPGYDPAPAEVVIGQGTTIHNVALDLARPGYGGLAGHVTDAASGAPLAATLSFTATSGLTYTLSADAAGYFRRLLVTDTYTVTAAAPDYTPTLASGVVVTTEVVTQDLALSPFHRLQVAPGFLNQMLEPGQQVTLTLSLTNPTPATVDWILYERPGLGRGDIAWLAVAPAMGTLAPGAASLLTVHLTAQDLPPDLYTASVLFSVPRVGWAETHLPVLLGVGLETVHHYLPLVMRGQ